MGVSFIQGQLQSVKIQSSQFKGCGDVSYRMDRRMDGWMNIS